MPKTASVRAIAGTGKVSTLTLETDGREWTAKAWANEKVNGVDSPAWEVGKTYSLEPEKKPGYNGGPEELWVSKKKASSFRGGGGGGKADPEKLAIEKERLEIEKQKNQRFDNKWAQDRRDDAKKGASIISQVILKAAVDCAITSTPVGEAVDPNTVAGFAADFCEVFKATQNDIEDFIMFGGSGASIPAGAM